MNAPTASLRPERACTVAPIDAAAAEAFLADRDDATPFHTSRWGRAVAAGCGHDAIALGAFDAEGRLRGYLPLMHVRSRLFGDAIVGTAFGVGGGILAEDESAARALADAAWALAGERDVGSVELRGGYAPGAGWTVDDVTYAGFVADLADTDEAQLLAIPRKQRAEVRKALAGDLTVRAGTAPRDRRDHYAVYAQSVRNLGTPVFPRALFDAVLDGFGKDADILTVYEGETPVASVLSLYHRGTVMPYWGGGTHAARQLRANERMYFELMLHARERGCTRFDFGRSKAGTGAYAYKKNWGLEPVPLTYFSRHADGSAPRSVNPLDPKYRLKIALWKKLPLRIANLLGPPIARGLG